MSAPKKLDGQTETQVVAMIARGDTHQQVVDWLKSEKSIDISLATVGVIKARNEEALSYMKNQLVHHETTLATTILDKSRRLINNRLDKALSLEDVLTDLRDRHENGELDDGQYYHYVDIELRNRLSATELNALSKESFNQSQLEAGKPTGITESPEQAKAYLATILSAIANKDDAALLHGLFPDA